ncbi:alpha/beta hydrolase family protein [Sarocladium implicatum]|nr:alpha/beta hydrolase family protein [Sarocladium implicatum]
MSPRLGEIRDVKVDVTVYAQYCAPAKGGNGIVQVLSHGLGEDYTYWDFNRDYSYVNHALEKGYATLAYDRIGNGRSSSHDPFDVLQAPVELAVLQELTRRLRNGKLHRRIPRPDQVIHVGNSFGSALSNALAATTPELTDGIVLGGYSHTPEYQSGFTLSVGFHLARETNPARFRGRSPGFLTWPDKYALQYAYYHWPNFEPAVLTEADKTKSLFTIG